MGLLSRVLGRGRKADEKDAGPQVRAGASAPGAAAPVGGDVAAPAALPVPEPLGVPVTIPVAGGGEVEGHLLAGDLPVSGVPGVLWLYGDSVPGRDAEALQVMPRLLFDHRPCVVLALDHPAGIEECHAALVWLQDNALRHGVATDQVFVGGQALGADLAVELALYERDEGRAPVAYLMALYPTLGAGWDATLPAYTRGVGLSGMPAAAVLTGMRDPARDQTIDLVERLRAAGDDVDFHMYRSRLRGTGLLGEGTDGREAQGFVVRLFDRAVEERRARRGSFRRTDLPRL
jgi:hypothetical protein